MQDLAILTETTKEAPKLFDVGQHRHASGYDDIHIVGSNAIRAEMTWPWKSTRTAPSSYFSEEILSLWSSSRVKIVARLATWITGILSHNKRISSIIYMRMWSRPVGRVT